MKGKQPLSKTCATMPNAYKSIWWASTNFTSRFLSPKVAASASPSPPAVGKILLELLSVLCCGFGCQTPSFFSLLAGIFKRSFAVVVVWNARPACCFVFVCCTLKWLSFAPERIQSSISGGRYLSVPQGVSRSRTVGGGDEGPIVILRYGVPPAILEELPSRGYCEGPWGVDPSVRGVGSALRGAGSTAVLPLSGGVR